jgi:hypothetical protein
MCTTYHVISDNRSFCICETQARAADHMKRLSSRGHVVWIEVVRQER